MYLSNCLCVTVENNEEQKDLDRVLSITQSVLSVTNALPSLTWSTNDRHTFIFADSKEFDIVKIVLQNNLGLFNDTPSQDMPLPNLDNESFRGPQHRYAVPRLSTDANAVGLREVPAGVGVPTTFVAATSSATPDFDNEVPWSEEYASGDEVDGDDHNMWRMHDADFMFCSSETSLTEQGEPDTNARSVHAGTERTFATVWNGSSVLDDNDRARWQLVIDRLNDEPNPTESNSGTITVEEQIAYSELNNPRHWNLVKCSYNGSRYYLSYICPPSVNMFDTLRIVGGMHANDTPEIKEICVYNTEPYWRELRHMMHQQVTSLREAVAA